MTINYNFTPIFGVNLFFIVVGINFFYILLEIIYSNRLLTGNFFNGYLIFFIWSYLTKFWAVSQEYYQLGIKAMLLTLVVIFILTNLIRTPADIDRSIWAIAWSGLLMFFYNILNFGLANTIMIRTMQNTAKFNANIYGLCAFFSAISFLYLYMSKKKSLMYLFLSMIMTILSLLSGSRKVILLFLIIILGIYLLNKGSKFFYRIFAIGIILVISYSMIMSNSFLYESIGVRIEETFNFFSSTGVASNTSTGIRSSMVELGLELFKQRPWVGYGVMGSYIYNGDTYLHNNYIELLVNTGVIGTGIYYVTVFPLLFLNFRSYIKNRGFQTLFFLLLIFSIVIMDYTIVSYNERIILLLLILVWKVREFDYLQESRNGE